MAEIKLRLVRVPVRRYAGPTSIGSAGRMECANIRQEFTGMRLGRTFTTAVFLVFGLVLAGCSDQPVATPTAQERRDREFEKEHGRPRSEQSLFSILSGNGKSEELGRANRYIWNAALETLDFLPIETVDPFSGVISTGFGVPPGGSRPYRATILVNDPALDARSLTLSLSSRSGPVDAATLRRVEDAILTRARQLRARDANL